MLQTYPINGDDPIRDFISLCINFSNMGEAVQEQLIDVVFKGSPTADQNPNAIDMCIDFMSEALKFAGYVGGPNGQFAVGVDNAIDALSEEPIYEDVD